MLFKLALDIGNQTATDGFSESNALRAANAFLVEGLAPSYGLQRSGYGLLYPGQGHAGHPDSYVYTHYPPGPDFLLTLYQRIFDELNVPLFRVIHIYVFIACIVFLGQAMVPILGVARMCILTALMGCVPATYSMACGLHYQGLSLSLLLAQVGVIANICRQQRGSRVALLTIFGLGFIQGWLSFDYFFLTTLVAVPGYFIFSPSKAPLNIRTPATLCASAALGFGLAHLLHFGQNVMYFQGITPAVNDMLFAAKTRSYSDVEASYWEAALKAVKRYLTNLPFQREYLGPAGYAICILVGVVCLFPLRSFSLFKANFCVSGRLRLGVIAAIIVAYLWVISMPAHALIHQHFIPRHLVIVPLFVLIAFLISTRPIDSAPSNTQQLLVIKKIMYLMLAVPAIALSIRNQSLLPKNWASYHHAGFTLRSAEQPWSRWHFDRATDGQPLSVSGVKFNHGIGTHPQSRIRISAPSHATHFSGGCGIQDGWPNGSVRCYVYQRGALLWSSNILRHSKAAEIFNVPIAQGHDIVLMIDDGGDQYDSDISNWLDLHFSP
ncbi:MAG: NPCBM/NEW2 domain-containing protein [Pseudomonadota bacterium]